MSSLNCVWNIPWAGRLTQGVLFDYEPVESNIAIFVELVEMVQDTKLSFAVAWLWLRAWLQELTAGTEA